MRLASPTGSIIVIRGDRRGAHLPRDHGEAARGREALRRRGHRAPAAVPRQPARLVHGRRRRAVLRGQPLGVRELRRARAAARRAAGGRALEGVPLPAAAAPAHAVEPDHGADLVLADPVSALAGKVALVTGGAQGIGRAIADGLAAAGATVVVADLSPPEGGIRADVSDEADVEAMVRETVDRHGGLDVLVNNAGLYASLA